MANANRPKGAVPVRSLDGSTAIPVNPYAVDASNSTAIFLGDFVAREADGNIAPAAAAGVILGAAVGVADDYDNLTRRYLPASTAGTVYVADDPDLIFEVQEDDGGTALTAAACGANTDIVAGAGSATTGISAHELNQDGVTSATAQLRLIRLVPRENNAYGDNADWEVKINEHAYTTAAGV
jgi:hypothetical protein